MCLRFESFGGPPPYGYASSMCVSNFHSHFRFRSLTFVCRSTAETHRPIATAFHLESIFHYSYSPPMEEDSDIRCPLSSERMSGFRSNWFHLPNRIKWFDEFVSICGHLPRWDRNMPWPETLRNRASQGTGCRPPPSSSSCSSRCACVQVAIVGKPVEPKQKPKKQTRSFWNFSTLALNLNLAESKTTIYGSSLFSPL